MNDKKLAAVVPFVLLVILIAFMQAFVVPHLLVAHQTELAGAGQTVKGLHLLGYEYNNDLVEISLTLWNTGSQPIIITGVSYDALALQQGVVGTPNDLVLANGSAPTVMTGTNMSQTRITIPNDIIFPASNHWNMYTEGPSEPVMQPQSMASLYLGVTSPIPGSIHVIVISSSTQQFVFEVKR